MAPERFGNLVVIDHGSGWHSAYGHLDKVTVKTGEKVRAGERIGLGGSTGEATGTELHFEIRKDGQPVDPAPKLGIDEAHDARTSGAAAGFRGISSPCGVR